MDIPSSCRKVKGMGAQSREQLSFTNTQLAEYTMRPYTMCHDCELAFVKDWVGRALSIKMLCSPF